MKLFLIIGLLLFLSCTNEHAKHKIARQYLSESQLPNLSSDLKGHLYLSEVEYEDSTNLLSFTKIKEDEIIGNRLVASGKDWFVNWADFPSVQVFPNGNHVFLHWLEKSGEGVYDYDIKFKIYSVLNDTSSESFKLNDSDVKGEYGFVSSCPYKDGIQLVWLDGRNAKTDSTDPNGHGHASHGAMSLRTSFLDTLGVLSPSVLLDDRVCDCCQTSICASEEKLFVQYRDRDEKEHRDISMLIYDGSWSEPIPFSNDNWKIAGCPVNGPSIDFFENTLASAWFTSANAYPEVKVAFYDTENNKELSRYIVSEGKTLGRVDIQMINADEAFVSYMDADEELAEIKIARVHTSLGITETTVLARNTNTRDSGFPHIEIIGDKLYYSYLDQLGTKQVEVGYMYFK